jgi:hypothetical protein
MIRPGRRDAIAALLAGTAALIGGQVQPARAKKKKKGKKPTEPQRCPTCPPATVCPVPTVCPPRLDQCPGQTCCNCDQTSATPGCRLGRAPGPGENTTDICDAVCGFMAWSSRRGSEPANGQTTGCDADTGQCVLLDCPLVFV